MNLPQHMAMPTLNPEVTYGILHFDGGHWHIEDSPPAVREVAKRLFPGCQGRNGTLSFPSTRRIVENLNWFLLRYPMRIIDRARFEAHRDAAIALANHRVSHRTLEPTAPPATFTGRLHPFQAEGVSYLVGHERTLLADDMGLGKTVTALAALATAEAFPALVVVPPTIRTQWRKQAEAFLSLPEDDPQALLVPNSRPLCHVIGGLRPYRLPKRRIYIIHYGLQGVGTCVVFAELDWAPAIHSQCEDRLHRIGVGSLDSVLCYYLVSQTGYDGVVMDALGLKVAQFVGLMGDRAETEEDRALAQSDAHRHLGEVIKRLQGGK